MSAGLLLSVIFLVLKLTRVIDWKYRYVFLPAIIEIVLTLIVVGILLAFPSAILMLL